MTDLQLERSVLAAKDRDELFAIAAALGVRASSRAKKVDLVTQILRATGVMSDEAEGMGGAQAQSDGAQPQLAATQPPWASGDPESADRADPGEASARTAPTESPNGQEPSGALDEASEGASAPMAAPTRPSRPSRPTASTHTASTHTASPRTPSAQTPSQHSETSADHGGADPEADFPTGTTVYTGMGSRPDGEGGRRNRRRRGRDRGDRPERELPAGQAPESQWSGEPLPVSGCLDLREEGYGFLRTNGYLPGPDDVYVSITQVRLFALRKGDTVEGTARPAGGNEKYPALLHIENVSGLSPDAARERPRFENLTPLFPDQKLRLEVPGDPANVTARIVDLISPIGKGQRGMIVSPPKAGKTTILKQIARSIEINNPDVHLMVLLVDERPEEVTDMRRSVQGEVVASTFDRPSEEHTQVAELAIERAKRMVEAGKD
ncbi:MAG: transcription termination factor Rho, partial [Acidimicrobiales bacterium]